MTTLDIGMYFGIPGSLDQLSVPKGNFDQTRVRQTDVYALGNGGYRVGRMVGGTRRFSINYAQLTYETFKTMEAYDQGHRGPGPFALLHPGTRNILTVNQSATTSLRNDTSNFTLAGTGASLASSSAVFRRGPRSLAWTASVASPTATIIALDTPAPEWPGYPVQVARSMVFAAQVRGGGTDGAVGVALTVSWITAAGGAISTTTGSTVVTSSGAWQQAVAIGSPPATSAYAVLKVNVVSGINSGDILYVDELMFHEGTAVDTTWSPGGAILPVIPLSLVDSWPLYASPYRVGPAFILQEVGGGA